MEHISKLNGNTYNISRSVEYETGKRDHITLIWWSPNQPDLPPTVLVDWYYGDYDYSITERYIAYYLKQGEN